MESPAAYGCAVIVSTAGQCQNDGCSMWGNSHGPKSGAVTHMLLGFAKYSTWRYTHVFDARKYMERLHSHPRSVAEPPP